MVGASRVDIEETAFPGAGVQLSGSISLPDAARRLSRLILVGGLGHQTG